MNDIALLRPVPFTGKQAKLLGAFPATLYDSSDVVKGYTMVLPDVAGALPDEVSYEGIVYEFANVNHTGAYAYREEPPE